jgi:multidrug transporter EmrE-like cation transporter
MGSPLSLLLIAAAGFFFMLANLVMKLMGHMPVYVLYPAIALAFAAGAYFEVEALKQAQLGYAVTFILALELLFSILIALVFLKETYTLGNLAGIALIVLGVSLLQMQSSKPDDISPAPASTRHE